LSYVPIKSIRLILMMRRRTLPLLCFVLLTAMATNAQESRSIPTAVSGVYSISFNLSILSALPAKTMITCKAQIVPSQGGLGTPHAAPGPVETAKKLAVVTGSKATCAVKIPFAWTVTGVQRGVELSYEIDAVSHSAAVPLLVRSSARQNINAPFPVSGGNTSLNFHLVF
jgi:hypothetical protein